MDFFNNLTNMKSDKSMLDKEYDNSMKDEYFNKIVSDAFSLSKEYPLLSFA